MIIFCHLHLSHQEEDDIVVEGVIRDGGDVEGGGGAGHLDPSVVQKN